MRKIDLVATLPGAGGQTSQDTPEPDVQSEREVDVRRVGSADGTISGAAYRSRGQPAAPLTGAEVAIEATAAGIRGHADDCAIGIVVALGEPPVVSYANPAFRRLAGADSHTVIGRPFFEAFPVLGSECVHEALCQVADLKALAGRRSDVEVTIEAAPPDLEADHAVRKLLLTVSPIRAPSSSRAGSAVGVVVQVRNASETGQKTGQDEQNDGEVSTAAHEANRAHNAALDVELIEVNQRLVIAALHEQELKERAEAANTAKSMFLATMSHELRTPLNAIIGYASLLDEEMWGPIQEEQHKHLERLKTSARHLLGLITDLLTLARVEADKEVGYSEDVTAETLVDEAMALTMPMAVAKRLDFSIASSEPFTLHTDRGKLLQILVNLIGNAIKFTNEGKITIGATARDGVAEFRIADTGIGISPANLNHVFDVFWQVEQNLTRHAGGAGLGLNVSQRLAHLLGGNVTVESAPNEGSVFTLTLPLQPPAPAT